LSSAGIIGIIKTANFPAMLSPDFGANSLSIGAHVLPELLTPAMKYSRLC